MFNSVNIVTLQDNSSHLNTVMQVNFTVRWWASFMSLQKDTSQFVFCIFRSLSFIKHSFLPLYLFIICNKNTLKSQEIKMGTIFINSLQ